VSRLQGIHLLRFEKREAFTILSQDRRGAYKGRKCRISSRGKTLKILEIWRVFRRGKRRRTEFFPGKKNGGRTSGKPLLKGAASIISHHLFGEKRVAEGRGGNASRISLKSRGAEPKKGPELAGLSKGTACDRGFLSGRIWGKEKKQEDRKEGLKKLALESRGKADFKQEEGEPRTSQ